MYNLLLGHEFNEFTALKARLKVELFISNQLI